MIHALVFAVGLASPGALPEVAELRGLAEVEVGRALALRVALLAEAHPQRPVVGEVLARLRGLPEAAELQGALCAHLLWIGAPVCALPACEGALAAAPEAPASRRLSWQLDRVQALIEVGAPQPAEDALAQIEAPAGSAEAGIALALALRLALDRGDVARVLDLGLEGMEFVQARWLEHPRAAAIAVRQVARFQAAIMGDAPLAERLLEAAGPLAGKGGDTGLQASLEADRALLQAQRDPQAALKAVGRAIGRASAIGPRIQVVGGLMVTFGHITHALRQTPRAEPVPDALARDLADRLGQVEARWRALAGPRSPDLPGLLVARARLLAGVGEPWAARRHFDAALALVALRPEQPEAAWTFDAYAQQAEAEGDLARAIWAGKRAIDAVAWGNAATRQIGGAQRALWLSTYRGPFERLAGWLVVVGRLAEAQGVQRQLKQRELEAFTRDASGAGAERGLAALGRTAAEARADGQLTIAAGPVLLAEQALARLQAAQTEALLAGRRLDADAQARLEAAQALVEAARATWLAALESAQDALRGRSAPAAPPAEALEALQATLRALGGDAAILQVLVAPKRLHLFLTTAGGLVARTVEVPAATLNAEVEALRRALGNPRAVYRSAAEQIYRRLIEPVRAELNAAGIETLVVSLDAGLRYIPLAALVDPATGAHLVERFALARYHDAARGQLERGAVPDWQVAGLGVAAARGGFPPLPAVPAELAAIVRRSPDDGTGVAAGIIRLDDDFNRASLAAALAGPFPGVHLASHFQFHPGTDQSSFLLLGDGSRLTVADLWRGAFDFKGVELLVLSACETAVEGGDGRELDGLAGVVQRRGVRSVIASLWPVADGSTAVLMARLYGRLVAGTPRAEALRAAQLGLLRGTSGAEEAIARLADGGSAVRGVHRAEGPAEVFVAPPGRPLAHPYYWAPFVLMGAWR